MSRETFHMRNALRDPYSAVGVELIKVVPLNFVTACAACACSAFHIANY